MGLATAPGAPDDHRAERRPSVSALLAQRQPAHRPRWTRVHLGGGGRVAHQAASPPPHARRAWPEDDGPSASQPTAVAEAAPPQHANSQPIGRVRTRSSACSAPSDKRAAWQARGSSSRGATHRQQLRQRLQGRHAHQARRGGQRRRHPTGPGVGAPGGRAGDTLRARHIV